MKNSILYTLIMNDKIGRYVMAAVAALALLVPFFNLVVPEGSFFHVPTYAVTLLGKYLRFALLALALEDSLT